MQEVGIKKEGKSIYAFGVQRGQNKGVFADSTLFGTSFSFGDSEGARVTGEHLRHQAFIHGVSTLTSRKENAEVQILNVERCQCVYLMKVVTTF